MRPNRIHHMSADVVVTGIGVLSSFGRGVGAFTEALRNGTNGITFNSEDGLGLAARLEDVAFDDHLQGLNLDEEYLRRARNAGRRAPLSAQASIITALDAWQDAFGVARTYLPEDVNILVAGSNISQGYQYRMREKYQESPEYMPASYTLHFLDSDQIGLISEILGIQGEGVTVGAASASGNMGILQAYRQVKYGQCKACVVVAAMADYSPVELQSFAQTGALGGKRFANDPEQACRPFDAEREGFIYGQGSACLVLESAQSAINRGAAIWGQVAGAATCLDANRSSDPSAMGEVRCMRLALDDAGIQSEDIDYINAHGTSSVLGDQTEAEAIKVVLGNAVAEVQVNSTKGLIGHCLYAAGAVESVATLIQMKEGFLHPNLNLRSPLDEEIQFVGYSSYKKDVDIALNNSFGFGGINTSVVLKKLY